MLKMLTNGITTVCVLAILSGCTQSTIYYEVEDLPIDNDLLMETQKKKKEKMLNGQAEPEEKLEYDEDIVEYR